MNHEKSSKSLGIIINKTYIIKDIKQAIEQKKNRLIIKKNS